MITDVDVEPTPAAKILSPWSLPPDDHLDQVAERARRVERLLADASLNDPENVRLHFQTFDLLAYQRWKADNWEWFWRARRAGVSRRHWPADLGEGTQTAAVKATRQFLECPDENAEQPACLVLCGKSGIGKTFAAVAALRSVMEGQSLAFFDVRVLSRALMDPERREETLERALISDVLVLDDLGAGYVKQDSFLESLLEEIFIAREADPDETTLVTSNLTRDQLDSVMGHRVADRLAGRWASVVELRGAKSLRRERS